MVLNTLDKNIVVVGAGTAGLTSALMLRAYFPTYKITIIGSSKIGIIGVGEGSTEHFRHFVNDCKIDICELLRETKATFKSGIRFENWTEHTPDYYHSIAGEPKTNPNGVFFEYLNLADNNRLLSETFNRHTEMHINNVLGPNEFTTIEQMYQQVNQYHFDTFKMNEYLIKLSSKRNITFIDSEVVCVNKNASGFIETIQITDGSVVGGDFFIDATGLMRVLMKTMDDQRFVSFAEYLPCDSAIAFPTERDPSGEIRPYTRARAMNSGWMFEIPTQERRGNGYVYCSEFCTEEEAVREASQLLGINVVPKKKFKFNAGYWAKSWQKNCIAIGLSATFVEPLEATSITTSIQQTRMLASFLPTFTEYTTKSINEYHRHMDSLMENILSMIALHYISDREDTPMWKHLKSLKRPEQLTNMLELWQERPPAKWDIPSTGYEMFLAPHFWHVAQGQGMIKTTQAEKLIYAYQVCEELNRSISATAINQVNKEHITHAKALEMLYEF